MVSGSSNCIALGRSEGRSRVVVPDGLVDGLGGHGGLRFNSRALVGAGRDWSSWTNVLGAVQHGRAQLASRSSLDRAASRSRSDSTARTHSGGIM